MSPVIMLHINELIKKKKRFIFKVILEILLKLQKTNFNQKKERIFLLKKNDHGCYVEQD